MSEIEIMPRTEASVEIISKSVLMGREIDVYGSADDPLFKAKDVAEWIEHKNPRMMLESVADGEKRVRVTNTHGGNQKMWFLTEDGLYEVFMKNRKQVTRQFMKGVKEIIDNL